jgi:hypothetical protein
MAIFSVVSANPIIPSRPSSDVTFRLPDPVSGILYLFILNFLVNLSWITIGLFISSKVIGHQLGSPPKKGINFLLALLAGVAVITLVGAFVDYYLVTQSFYIEGVTLGTPYHGWYHLVSFDLVQWSVALVMIFVSIVLSLLLFLRLRASPSALTAGFVTILNPVWWVLIGEFGEKASFATIIVGIIAAPVMLRWALIWRFEEPAPTKRDSETTRMS